MSGLITDDMLHHERPHLGGVQRVYHLGNGYGLSLVNAPMLHSYPFAWEAAVVTLTERGMVNDLVYDTPLTNDVEVFETTEEANAFIAEAKAWAAANPMKGEAA